MPSSSSNTNRSSNSKKGRGNRGSSTNWGSRAAARAGATSAARIGAAAALAAVRTAWDCSAVSMDLFARTVRMDATTRQSSLRDNCSNWRKTTVDDPTVDNSTVDDSTVDDTTVDDSTVDDPTAKEPTSGNGERSCTSAAWDRGRYSSLCDQLRPTDLVGLAIL